MTVISRPDLGIYDTREWDHNYHKYTMQDGQDPGRHPDPDCIWNQSPELYDDVEYQLRNKERYKVTMLEMNKETEYRPPHACKSFGSSMKILTTRLAMCCTSTKLLMTHFWL